MTAPDRDPVVAALEAQSEAYAERMMRREWRVVPQAGVEPGDERANWYIEAIDTRFRMHSLVMWAYQSKSAYDRAFLERVCAEHNATIREALATPAASCDHCGSAEGSAAHFREGDWLCALATPDARVAELEAAVRDGISGLLWSTGAWRPEGTPETELAGARIRLRELVDRLEAALAPGEPKEGE